MKSYKLLIILILFSHCDRLNKSVIILEDVFLQLADSMKIEMINFVELPPPIYLNDSIKKVNPKLLVAFNDSLKIMFSKDLCRNLKKDLNFYDSIVEKYGSYPKVWFGINDRFFGGGV